MSDRDRAEFWAAVRTVSQLKRREKIDSQPTELEPSSPLIAIQSGSPQKKPVFMVPGIVGEGEETTKLFLGFARIAHYLDPEQPLYALKPWGIIEGEQNFRPVEVIASDYIKVIRDFQTEGPYFLGGECVGGVIAFEMAQQLTAQGEKVALLFLLDTRPPNNERTILNYKPQPYSGRTVLLATEERLRQKSTLAWSQLVTGGLEIQTIPGTRSNYIREQAQTIGEKLRIYLDSSYPPPAPDQVRQESKKTFVAPRDELEHQLTQIWEEVLGIRPICVRDNFFALGGDSLLSVNLLHQIREVIGQDIPLDILLIAPTIEKLAHILRQQGGIATRDSRGNIIPSRPSGFKRIQMLISRLLNRESSSYLPSLIESDHLVAIKSDGCKRPLFVVASHPWDFSFCAKWKHHLEPERPFYLLKANNGKKLYTQVEELAANLLEAMQGIQPEGPYLLVGQCAGGIIAFEMAQQLQAKGQKVLLILQDTPRPYDDAAYQNYLIDRFQKGRKLIERITSLLNKIPHLGLGKWLLYFVYKAKTAVWLYLYYKDRYVRHVKQIAEEYFLARARYRPTTYPERIVFLLSNKYDRCNGPTQVWGSLAVKGLELHLVPRKPNDNYDQAAAETLKTFLESLP